MEKPQDIRWQQRFANYKRALAELTEFIEKKSLNKYERQGLIQAFEYTHELAWKTLQDFLKERGVKHVFGSRDASREAFNLDLIKDGHVWMDMIDSRNQTSHTYNLDVADKIAEKIFEHYHRAFLALETKLDEFA